MPVLLLNYIATVPEEEYDNIGILSLGVLDRNLAMVATLPRMNALPNMNTFSAAVEQSKRIEAPDLLMDTQIQEI